MADVKLKRALVLGCGAVAGAAWMIPALAQVREQLNWNPEEADIFIGTSVGAVLVSLMAGGVSLDDLIASQEEGAEDNKYRKVWNHDKDSGPWYPPLPKFKFTAKNLYTKMRRGELASLTGWTGLLPQGGFDMKPFVKLIDRVKNESNWVNHDNCWLVAVDDQSGERKAFGCDQTEVEKLDISQAVCASYGVPGWCPPVEINSRTYIDGGIVSPCSADLLVDSDNDIDIDEVIMLVPMACTEPDKPFSLFKKIERNVRKGMTAIVDKEVALLEAAGIKVIRIEPTAEDLKAFGYNMMDPRRRGLVYETSKKTSPSNVRKAIS
jgi:NTE family protein